MTQPMPTITTMKCLRCHSRKKKQDFFRKEKHYKTCNRCALKRVEKNTATIKAKQKSAINDKTSQPKHAYEHEIEQLEHTIEDLQAEIESLQSENKSARQYATQYKNENTKLKKMLQTSKQMQTVQSAKQPKYRQSQKQQTDIIDRILGNNYLSALK